MRIALRGYCTLTAGDPGKFFLILLCMQNKTYSLVAWTEKSEVRMVPSLINECSLPYREKIEYLESHQEAFRDKAAWLLERSRAHAALARFFLRVGRPREAYQEYSNAAEVCALCYDGLWVQGERCDVPMKPLYKRFHAMHSRCLELAEKHPVLRKCYEGSSLQDHFLWFTLDEREDRRELREARESSRSWRFGKTA